MIDEKHPFFTQEKLLKPIVRILSMVSQDISFISYSKYYTTGQGIFLSQARETDVEVLNQRLLPTIEELENNISRYVFLSERLPLPEAAVHLEIFQKNIDINIHGGKRNRLFIVYKSPGFIETLEFNTNNNDVLNTYMNQISLLERFYSYFCREAKHLITAMDNYSIPFDVAADYSFTPMEAQQTIECRRFLHSLSHQEKIQLNNGNKQYTISPREFECLYWCAKNKTAKQIAHLMKISPRTIETYLINLKSKLSCNTKLELIDFAQNDSLVRFFSE